MPGIGNSNRAHPTQNHPSENSRRPGNAGHPSENSRRPGNAGHPGKHLGQFKKAGIKPDLANQSLIKQQLNAMQGDTKNNAKNDQQQLNTMQGDTKNNAKVDQQLNAAQEGDTKSNRGNNVKTEQKPDDSILSLTANHMNDMSDVFADQISFTSRMHAISTGLF